MLSLNRICCYLIIFGLIFLIPSTTYIKFTDELISFSLLGIAMVDCIFNGNFRKYRLLWIVMSIVTAYAFYSVAALNYNTPRAILLDWIIELKPYLPFCVLLAVGPRFTASDRKIIRIICIINAAICLFSFLMGIKVIRLIMTHPTYPSQYAIISGIYYYFCSIDPRTNRVSRRDTLIAMLLMAIGILGFKAKILATLVPSFYLMTLYRPGLLKNFNFRHALTLILIGVAVVAVSWNKFEYYFLKGNSESFDTETVESFARPVLYATGGLILFDHFPLGTGLASFATFASGESYSSVYYEYGIQNIHGLSYRNPEFVADAFYPSLAQFGVVGLILFIWFWVYAYGFLRRLIRKNSDRFRPIFIVGSIIIIFNLVECFGATTLTQVGGMISMCLLGICCADGKFSAQTTADQTQPPVATTRKI